MFQHLVRFRFRLPFPIRVLVLAAAVTSSTACGEIISDDGGGDDDGTIVPGGSCNDASECRSYEGCVVAADGSGECRTLCTVFENGCSSGESCVIGATYGVADSGLMYCLEVGTVDLWQACGAADGCAAELSCINGTCVPNCDDEHPCESSLMTCTPPPNFAGANPSNGGACQ